jgi:hypothetical protein
VTPLERDAIEGFQRAIHENTPTVFHESIKAAIDETAKPIPEVKPPRPGDAPAFDPNYPRPPDNQWRTRSVIGGLRLLSASSPREIEAGLMSGFRRDPASFVPASDVPSVET